MMTAAALAACAHAGAAERVFEVVYQGFYAEHDAVFEADTTLEVLITVNDLDGDGSYSHEELVSLESGNINYYGFCGAITCVTAFGWDAGGEPRYFASYTNQNGLDYTSSTIYAGKSFTDFYQSSFGFRYDYEWTWTDATTTTITDVTPVPEPAQYGMLAAGLAGMLALGRRRRG
ncbi:PEP-CTERM sorting domain-containing protein [Pseudoduganella sp. SL102]|uniref:PEP-CTERM sorting domain-containing protein n=1 Tax=Pseudoduganella sp. SL102 TaxID=2995154 RepID=UPI00248ABDD0|nr:PEP-CTERM sorting domain-containing protein [Pseudoduganella sp. SL102]WBS02414.1 PEP-CTERM sorting domain-containing protein [Pseudoduganella sp. SL102]